MLDGEKILSRLSVTGLSILLVGLLLGFGANKLCTLIFKEKADKWVLPCKLVGLALSIWAALILLDVIPWF